MLLLALLMTTPAVAYIGPGAGLPVIGSLLAILSTILLAIIAIVAWPVRKMLKKKKARAAEESADTAE